LNLYVAYTALFIGVAVWFLLVRKLRAKPWEVQAAPTTAESEEPGTPTAKIGLWVFLCVITSLFGLFISAYYMRMGGHGHTTATDWAQLTDPAVLWLNTLLLILASVAMQSSRASVARGRADRTRDGLMIGGLLTLAFLAGQFYAWRQIVVAGDFSPRNPAVAFFYLLTAVHGLHLLGGLYVWARTLLRLHSKDVELIDVRLSVDLCTVYWHYLLLVWLGLFALLLST
jgi:cytochrome c oxidase subunit III